MSKTYIPGRLTPADFRHMRQGLLMTQRELATVLGYRHKIRVSEFERPTNPVSIPLHIQQAMVDMWHRGGPGLRQGESVRDWVRRDAA